MDEQAPADTYKAASLRYVREVLEQLGIKATELARRIGVNQTTLTRPLNNAEHKYAVKFQTLQAIERNTGIPLPADILSAREAAKGPAPKELRLAIRHQVAAGAFLRRDDLPQEPYGYRVVPSIRPYEHNPQWLERVVGDSMSLMIPEGSLIHVVDAIDISYKPRHGDVVVLERTAMQGSLVERTVKQVAIEPGGPEFWPRSHNPQWSKPIRLAESAEEDLSVHIVGLVLRSYMFFAGESDD